MRKHLPLLALILFGHFLPAQDNQPPRRLKVFIDCSNTWCDQTFIRSEINIVDFLLDNQASDVHVLITEQSTGSGGSQYQLIFFGQNSFKHISDTLRFNTDPNATEFEERDLLIKYLKLGLSPYVIKAGGGDNIIIEMKIKDGEQKKDSLAATKDPWNYWVFRVGGHGYMNADAVYNNSNLGASLSATRITDKVKLAFEAWGGKSRDRYYLEDTAGGKEKILIKNENYSFSHYLVKSINDHWSWGYETGFSRNTFSNNKAQVKLRSGIEYNIFPYKAVNTKLLTISYVIDARRNLYFDTTLYGKLKETLFGHALKARLSINQKWGMVSLGSEFHNYFHNWKFLNLNMNAEVNIRITGGLSVSVYTFAGLARDQLFLSNEKASAEDVLTRRRQIASNYNIYTSFSINYRFGSKLNNFVNPRFD